MSLGRQHNGDSEVLARLQTNGVVEPSWEEDEHLRGLREDRFHSEVLEGVHVLNEQFQLLGFQNGHLTKVQNLGLELQTLAEQGVGHQVLLLDQRADVFGMDAIQNAVGLRDRMVWQLDRVKRIPVVGFPVHVVVAQRVVLLN